MCVRLYILRFHLINNAHVFDDQRSFSRLFFDNCCYDLLLLVNQCEKEMIERSLRRENEREREKENELLEKNLVFRLDESVIRDDFNSLFIPLINLPSHIHKSEQIVSTMMRRKRVSMKNKYFLDCTDKRSSSMMPENNYR